MSDFFNCFKCGTRNEIPAKGDGIKTTYVGATIASRVAISGEIKLPDGTKRIEAFGDNHTMAARAFKAEVEKHGKTLDDVENLMTRANTGLAGKPA